jgi:hypothetical protein
MRAIRAALLLPLRNPVTIAIATIPQEERRRKEIRFILIDCKPMRTDALRVEKLTLKSIPSYHPRGVNSWEFQLTHLPARE